MNPTAIASISSLSHFRSHTSFVVGYQANALRYGNKAMGASFAAVTGSTLDLNDLTVTGYDKADGCGGAVQVQVLDSVGMGGETYSWYDVVDGEDVIYGWLDSSDENIPNGEVVLAPGEGLWIYAPNEAYNLQSAGTVPTTGIAVVLRSGNKLAVNNTPLSVDLNDISVSGYSQETGCEGAVQVQVLDSVGMGGKTYSWYDVVDGEDVIYGWIDSSDENIPNGEVVLAPGEGLWVYSPSTAYYLNFPGVTL